METIPIIGAGTADHIGPADAEAIKVYPVSPILYLSKISSLFACPRRYWWMHRCRLIAKSKSPAMTWGSDFHSIAEIGNSQGWDVALAEIETRDWKEEQKDETRSLILKLKEKMEEEGIGRVYEVEHTALIPIFNSKYFTEWSVKCDLVAEFGKQLWNGELKTTGGYGAATAAFYHNSMQTLHYFHYIKDTYPHVRGTKLFVCVRAKTKERVEVEDILVTKDQIKQAEMFRNNALAFADLVEENQFYPRFMTKCHTVKEGECAYKPICFVQNKEYRAKWIEELYEVRNPDEHLGLGSVE